MYLSYHDIELDREKVHKSWTSIWEVWVLSEHLPRVDVAGIMMV